MTCGGSGGVRKCGFPRLQVLRGGKLDIGEKVLSSARDPRLGNGGTTLERVS